MIKKILFTFAILLTTVSFVQAQQDINVQGNGTDIVDGDTTPDIADHTDFGSVPVGSSVIRTFTIQNVGNVALNLTSIGKTIGTNAQFTVDISSVATPVAASGGFTTFTVTYTPTITGVSTGGIIIGSDSPAPEDSYTFSIQAEGIAGATPDINVQGNGIDIVDGDTTPDLADHTDFGSVPVGSSVTRTFTIQNVGSSDLNLSAVGKSIGTNAQFTVDISSVATPLTGGGGFTTFTVTYTPTIAGVSNGGIVIGSDSPAPEDSYTFSIQAEGTAAGAQDINVQGNGIDILDGDTTPDLADHTDFGEVTIGSPLTRTFTIQNTGGADLNLTALNLALGTNAQFSIDNSAVVTPVVGGSFTTFTVTFTPTVVGVVTGQVRIVSDDPDGESTYTFDIQAEGKDIVSAGSKLLITQYYEGTGTNDQWIEIKNISSDPIIAGSYFLALYSNFQTITGTIDVTAPDAGSFIAIGAMAAGEVRLYSNFSASLPLAANRGAVPIETGACNFDGNDVILISTSTGTNCYNDRIDIMGVVGATSPPFWGQNISYVKGCGTVELPSLEFDVITVPDIGITAGDYVRVQLEDVNVVDDTNTNIALGTQVLGSTEWNGSWTNLKPDRTRDVLISGSYTAANGSLTTCNLDVTGTINLDAGTSNYVDVHKNLTITGSFTLGDTESLYFDVNNENAVITGAVTKKETTTQLTNINDFTYWSSPVTNAAIASVFSENNLNRVYYWDQQAANTVPGGGTEALGEWFVASGTMKPGVGYISEGPTAGAYPTNHTIEFTGKPNNGVVIVSGTPQMWFNNDGNTFNDYNVIGNPYPSAIDADLFLSLADNSTIDATIWFWTHNTPVNNDPVNRYNSNDYACYNLTGGVGTGTPAGTGGPTPTQYIGSGQGFLVRAVAGGTGAIFNNAMRVKDQNTQFFRGADSKKSSTDKDRVWLNMEAEGGSYNEILLGFFDNATDTFDRGYDGLKNGAGWVSFYSTMESDTLKYSIQGLNTFNVDKKVTLGLDTYINEDVLYKISIAKLEGVLTENDVYIVDNELNITHDLKLAPYEFNLGKDGNYPERFTLQFTKSTLGTDDFNLNNNFVVLNEDNGLRVKSSTPVSTIQVFDVTGRLLVNSKPNASEFVIDSKNIKKGTILILNATFENGAKLSKKAINY